MYQGGVRIYAINYNSNPALRSFDDVARAFLIVTFPVCLLVRLRLLSWKRGEE